MNSNIIHSFLQDPSGSAKGFNLTGREFGPGFLHRVAPRAFPLLLTGDLGEVEVVIKGEATKALADTGVLRLFLTTSKLPSPSE